MSTLQCIVFDMDGTLTQTNQLIYDSFNYIAKKYRNREYSIPEIAAMFGPPEEDALLAIVDRSELDMVMKDYLEFYRSHHRQQAKLYPGIESILHYCKIRGKHLAVFTGKGRSTTKITLEEFHVEQYFDYIVTGNDVKNHKPSSEGLRKILEHFSLNKDEVLMVGDAVSDITASREAGIKIASVLWDSYAKDKVLLMNTDFVFHSVEDFRLWLQEQF